MSREAFEKDIYSNVSHSITSENILVEKETGRVVAVFYNDYDLDSVVEQLAQAPVVADEHKIISDFVAKIVNQADHEPEIKSIISASLWDLYDDEPPKESKP